jgi:prevent-host-death family protein
MPKSLQATNRAAAPTPNNRWEWGERFGKQQEAMSKPSFARLIREQGWSLAGASTTTIYGWIRDYRALADAVPYDVARAALVEVTNGKGLVTEGVLSDRYAVAFRKHAVPFEGTSYEECLDWARGVLVVADHHVSLKAAPESWQIQSAKARFSEVFRKARTEGPQRITRQGKEGVVMVAEEQYEQLVGKSRQPKNIVDFFRQSPLLGLKLDLKRDRSPARDIDL